MCGLFYVNFSYFAVAFEISTMEMNYPRQGEYRWERDTLQRWYAKGRTLSIEAQPDCENPP